MQFLKQFSQSKLYWVLLLILGLSMESVALYYQYVLDEWPCVLCIHVRIWVSGFIVLSVLALIVKHSSWTTRIFHLANTVLMIGFVERSWQTLAVERGWIFGDCNMEAGLPLWFALDKWFPALFEVKASCGYTPYIILEISIAEILMVVSSGLLVASLILLVVSFLRSADS
jgi:disulfide bond formation protein DsbB